MERTVSALASELLARLPSMAGEEQRLGLEIYRQPSPSDPSPPCGEGERRVRSCKRGRRASSL